MRACATYRDTRSFVPEVARSSASGSASMSCPVATLPFRATPASLDAAKRTDESSGPPPTRRKCSARIIGRRRGGPRLLWIRLERVSLKMTHARSSKGLLQRRSLDMIRSTSMQAAVDRSSEGRVTAWPAHWPAQWTAFGRLQHWPAAMGRSAQWLRHCLCGLPLHDGGRVGGAIRRDRPWDPCSSGRGQKRRVHPPNARGP